MMQWSYYSNTNMVPVQKWVFGVGWFVGLFLIYVHPGDISFKTRRALLTS